MPEEPGVRELAHGQVQLYLVVGDVESAAELGDVLRDEGRGPVRHERDADVSARDDLFRELAHDLTQLHREQGTADGAHDLPGVGDHALHLLRCLLREDAGERIRDAEGDGFGELAPEGHRLACPLRPADQEGRTGELRHRGDLVEPEGGDVEGLVECSALGGRDRVGAVGRERARLLQCHVPVDAAIGVADGVLQTAEQLLDAGGIVRQTRDTGEPARVDGGIAGKELPEHPGELVLRLGSGIVGHRDASFVWSGFQACHLR